MGLLDGIVSNISASTVSGSFISGGVASVTLTGNVSVFDPAPLDISNISAVKIYTTHNRNIEGMVAGQEGQRMIFLNTSNKEIKLKSNKASTPMGERFLFDKGEYKLKKNTWIEALYEKHPVSGNSYWYIEGR